MAHKILIVDDEEGIRKSLSIVLSKKGYVIFQAQDGGEAVDFLSQNRAVDAVLLDIKMPVMDGLKVLDWIVKENIVTSVIMLTGLMELDTAINTIKSGAFDYLTKPVTKEDLVATVEKAVENTKSLRSRLVMEEEKAKYERQLHETVKKQARTIRELLSIPADRPSKRIIVVEPDEEVLGFLTENLSSPGHRVESAGSAREALDMALAEPPDMIITTLATPEMDGIALAKAVRANDVTRGVRLMLILQEDAAYSQMVDSKDAGVDDFLQKPIEVEDLLFRVGLQLYREESGEILGGLKHAGTFSGIDLGANLDDFVSFLLKTHRSAILKVESHDGQKGMLYFHRGEIVHSHTGELTGKEAFFRTMSFPGGSYTVLPWKRPEEETIDEPGEFLLLEARRIKGGGDMS